jgi:GNAT superfamily N-acetyltransferase
MLASPKVSLVSSVHQARAIDLEGAGDDLVHAFDTDPDGAFLARSPSGATIGRAAGVVRGDTLQLVELFVEPAERGRGVGRALFDAVRAYGASRGARHIETVSPNDPATLGFLLRRGLPVRTLVLRLETAGARASAREDALSPVTAGAALSGWVADLDRETRGVSREKEWAHWMRSIGGGVFALSRRGRPEAVGAIRMSDAVTRIGPVEGRSPEAAASLIEALSVRAPSGKPVLLDLPEAARTLLAAAFTFGFRLSEILLVLSSRSKGDLRRMAASGTAFF